ncbi:MAG: hypothetical protein Q4B70_15400 [Lachnospiraceae bacterium]|nr:hypothetical protein [Lachnospiraceae bacterium]
MSEKTHSLVNLRGQIERITYNNEENDYTVLKAKVYGYSELVTVVGNIASPTLGEVLNMSGEWIAHPRFGNQFKVVFYKCSIPASITGIERYLGSGLIKGIGPVMSKRIVKLFGEKPWIL